MEDVWFNSGDIRLRGGLFVPVRTAEAKLPGLVYCSGFPGSDKSSMKVAESLSREGYVALWVRNVRGLQRVHGKAREAAMKLNPIDYVGKLSPRPLLIVHRRNDIMVPVDNAYELDRHAAQPKELIIAEGWMHTDSDSFFSSGERKDGAIRLTLNWLKRNL